MVQHHEKRHYCHIHLLLFLSVGNLPNFTHLPKKIEKFTGKKYFTEPITELSTTEDLILLTHGISQRLIYNKLQACHGCRDERLQQEQLGIPLPNFLVVVRCEKGHRRVVLLHGRKLAQQTVGETGGNLAELTRSLRAVVTLAMPVHTNPCPYSTPAVI